MTSAAMTPDLDRATREAPRRLVVLGSTGSIGTQALEVVGAAARLARPESGATHPPFPAQSPGAPEIRPSHREVSSRPWTDDKGATRG